MRILYDASSLGRGFGSELTRSGIFRTSREFAEAIRGRPGISVRFAALPSLLDEIQLWRYRLAHDEGLAGALIRAWDPGEPLEACIELVDRLDSGVEPDARRLAMAELKLLDATARPLAVPETFDVFHSLRAPLPPRDRVASTVRVLSLHDTIPALFPELCDDRFVPYFESLLASLDVERDFVICHSASTRDDIVSLTGMAADRVFVVPLAASGELFSPPEDEEVVRAALTRHGIGHGGYVLSVGTLEPRKNLTALVEAFSRLLREERFADRALVLVGERGWKSRPIFDAVEAAREVGVPIVLPGHVPDADLAALYAGAALFVYPSVYEGFGLPVLEAMRCGAPVITSDVSSLPEVAGDAALTVAPTPDAIHGAMRRVLDDPELARDLGRRGLARGRRFSWAKSAERTLEAYRQMLDSTRRTPPTGST